MGTPYPSCWGLGSHLAALHEGLGGGFKRDEQHLLAVLRQHRGTWGIRDGREEQHGPVGERPDLTGGLGGVALGGPVLLQDEGEGDMPEERECNGRARLRYEVESTMQERVGHGCGCDEDESVRRVRAVKQKGKRGRLGVVGEGDEIRYQISDSITCSDDRLLGGCRLQTSAIIQ